MTLFFPSESITILRQRRIGSTARFGMSATFTAYQADVQPASPDRVQTLNEAFGAVYTAYIDANIDIKENDQIRTGDKTYGVKGVQRWEGAGLLDHIELLLVSKDA